MNGTLPTNDETDSETWTGAPPDKVDFVKLLTKHTRKIAAAVGVFASAIWITGIAVDSGSYFPNIVTEFAGILLEVALIVGIVEWLLERRAADKWMSQVPGAYNRTKYALFLACQDISNSCRILTNAIKHNPQHATTSDQTIETVIETIFVLYSNAINEDSGLALFVMQVKIIVSMSEDASKTMIDLALHGVYDEALLDLSERLDKYLIILRNTVESYPDTMSLPGTSEAFHEVLELQKLIRRERFS